MSGSHDYLCHWYLTPTEQLSEAMHSQTVADVNSNILCWFCTAQAATRSTVSNYCNFGVESNLNSEILTSRAVVSVPEDPPAHGQHYASWVCLPEALDRY